MVSNVRCSNGPPSHVTLPFEYQTSILSGIQVIILVDIQVGIILVDFSPYGNFRPFGSAVWSKIFGRPVCIYSAVQIRPYGPDS